MAGLTDKRFAAAAGFPVFMNTRAQAAGLTGVQRYSIELQQRIRERVKAVEPTRPLRGVKGHLWEQLVLPAIVRNGLLWSPANSGPVALKNQVITVHDVASLEHPEWFNPFFAAWYHWMTPKLVRRVRRVITGSEFSKQRLLALTAVNESHVVVIPEGVNSCFYPRQTAEVEQVRRRLSIPSPSYILSLSTLDPRKNLRRLMHAWASCSLKLPEEIWLVIAGSKGLQRVFSQLDLEPLPPRVHLTGFVADSDLPALYSGALAFACVSIYEGFGLPVLEAMACATTPVAANNTSLPEVTGDAGLLVNPLDNEEIAHAIERLVRDRMLRRELEKRALERSREFNWERTSGSTWEILHQEALACA